MGKHSARYNYISWARPILQRLESAGFEAYLVGGCVREALREEQRSAVAGFTTARSDTAQAEEAGPDAAMTDIDVTTNALPGEICRVFSDLPVIETGIRHGTVTVLLPVETAGTEDSSAAVKYGPAKCGPNNVSSDGTAGGQTRTADGSAVTLKHGPAKCDSAKCGPKSAARFPVEITTFRVDGPYSDGRHPDQVQFVASLTEDLRRRDFTVNAMAMDLRGELADPFGGQADLEAGIIRAVGDPQARFREDGLRILRALRFAAVLTIARAAKPCGMETGPTDNRPTAADARSGQLATGPAAAKICPASGFQIEPRTEAALFQCSRLLAGISAERIFGELKKLVCGPAAADVVRRYSDILAVIIPELETMKGFVQHNPYHKYDVLEHCIRAMDVVRSVPAIISAETSADGTDPSVVPAPLACMKLAALLHDIGKPGTFARDENGIGHFYGHPQAGAEIVHRVFRRLKADRWTIDRITTLVRYHDLVFQEDDRLLKRWMNRYTPQVLLEILELKRADNIATGNVSQELLDKFDRIESRIRCIWEEHDRGQNSFCIEDLAVGGRDLIEAGIPEGPQIGQTLQKLLDDVIDGILVNERDALLDSLSEHSMSGASNELNC